MECCYFNLSFLVQFYLLELKVQSGSKEIESTDFTLLVMHHVGQKRGSSRVFCVIWVIISLSRVNMEGKSPVLVYRALCLLSLSISDTV